MTRRRLGAAIALGAWAALQATAPRGDNPSGDPAAAIGAQEAVPAEVRATLQRACFDCHSDDTRWPWYARIVPVSWLVVHDVRQGRGQLNFSRWRDYNPYDRADLVDKMCDMTTKGRMPLGPYRWLHPDAWLSDPDVAALCAWTRAESARLTGGG